MLCLFYSRRVFISHLHVRLSQETIQLSGLFRGAGQWPDVNQQLQRQNKKKFLHVQKHKTATEMRRKHFFKSGNQSGTWNVSPEAKSRNGAGESLRYCPRHSYTWKHQVSQTLWIPRYPTRVCGLWPIWSTTKRVWSDFTRLSLCFAYYNVILCLVCQPVPTLGPYETVLLTF